MALFLFKCHGALTPCFLLVLLFFVSPLQAATTFSGSGQAVVIEGDRSAAEKLARNVARSQALGKAMERYVESGQVDRHQYNLKKSELLKGERSFIVGERVTSVKLEDPILRLQLQIKVDMQALSRALGVQGLATRKQIAQKQRNRPTTMVIVAEEINGAINSFPYSTQVIQDALLKENYTLVDKTASGRATKHDQAVQAMLNNDTTSARALALQFDAGLIVTGRAVVQKSGIKGGGMQSYGANVALSAISADTGRLLASSSAAGSYPHVNAITGSRLAIEEATQKALQEIMSRLDEQNQMLGTPMRLTINGVNYQQLAILKKIFNKEFPQVITIDNLGFTGDIARLDLSLASGVVEFAEALSRKNFGAFKLKILSQSPGKLDATVQLKRGSS